LAATVAAYLSGRNSSVWLAGKSRSTFLQLQLLLENGADRWLEQAS